MAEAVTEARHAGRVSFWMGRALRANPEVGVLAILWREGWRDEEARYLESSGAERAPGDGYPVADTKPYRPPDVAADLPGRVVKTGKGAGRKLASLGVQVTLLPGSTQRKKNAPARETGAPALKET